MPIVIIATPDKNWSVDGRFINPKHTFNTSDQTNANMTSTSVLWRMYFIKI